METTDRILLILTLGFFAFIFCLWLYQLTKPNAIKEKEKPKLSPIDEDVVYSKEFIDGNVRIDIKKEDTHIVYIISNVRDYANKRKIEKGDEELYDLGRESMFELGMSLGFKQKIWSEEVEEEYKNLTPKENRIERLK